MKKEKKECRTIYVPILNPLPIIPLPIIVVPVKICKSKEEK